MPGGSGRIDAPNVNAFVVGSSSESGVTAAPATRDEAPAEAEFDPNEHTVAEVREYLDRNPDDTDRVLAAERDGQARVSLVGD